MINRLRRLSDLENEQLLLSLTLEDRESKDKLSADEMKNMHYFYRNHFSKEGNRCEKEYQYINNCDDDDDDAMDIDDPNEYMVMHESDSNSSSDTTEKEKDETGMNNLTREPRRSESHVLSVLSPTMLGARLAVQKPLMLMPPPSPSSPSSPLSPTRQSSQTQSLPFTGHTTDASDLLKMHRKSSVDFEFDTSSFIPVHQYPKKVNSYNMKLENPSPDLLLANQLNNGDQNIHKGQFAIHHHHYYPPVQQHNPPYQQDQDHERAREQNLRDMSLILRSKKSDLDKVDTHYKNQIQAIDDDRQRLLKQNGYNNQYIEDYALVSLPPPWKAGITPIEKVPYILSSYLQFAINFVLSLYMVYLIYYICSSIKSDVNHRIYEQRLQLASDISFCRQQYYENNCDDPSYLSLPLMRKKCEKFRKCMEQNPSSIGNLSLINAQIVGMVLNSLIEPLSFKFFIFTLWCGVVIFGCNFVFGYIRAKTYYGDSTVATNPERWKWNENTT